MTRECAYCGQEERYGHNALCVMNTVEELRAEVERLKAGIKEYACTATDHPCGCYDQFLSERAEIERLRLLLRRHQVAAWCEEDSDLAVETRAALEPQP